MKHLLNEMKNQFAQENDNDLDFLFPIYIYMHIYSGFDTVNITSFLLSTSNDDNGDQWQRIGSDGIRL